MTESLPRTDTGYSDAMKALVGHTVTEVWWSDDCITFVTDGGVASYYVDGDCCSHSYLHDLIGLDKLLAGPVVSVNAVDLNEEDQATTCECCKHADVLAFYGYQIVTQHPTWGEVTCALSFRNDSNGYYGGDINRADDGIRKDQERLSGDRVTS